MKTAITIKNGDETFHVFVADHKQRIKTMHALARAGIVAGYGTIEGFQSNKNSNGKIFWGSIK
jgi:hypothetical protein